MFDKIDPYESVSDEEYRERARRLGLMLTLRPERHYQGDWAQPRAENECGTAACVAGWSTLWADGVVHIDAEGTMTWDPADMRLKVAGEPRSLIHVGEHNLAVFSSDLGQKFLGLDYAGAHALFYDATDEEARDVLVRLGSGDLSRHEVAEAIDQDYEY